MKRMFLLVFLAMIFLGLSLQSYAISFSKSTETDDKASGAVTSAVPAMESVSEAMAEFKSLSKQDRKARIKEVKKEIKHFKAEKKNSAAPSTNTLLLVILAILLPPLAVYLHQGEINNKFWISLILTLLFLLPGIIYALIVVLGAD